MSEVYITSLGAFLPGPPVQSKDMEDYLGRIHGAPSRYRALVLRQNRIKTRHYALDTEGTPRIGSAEMAANAIRNAVDKSETRLDDLTYLASSCTLGDLLLPGLASHTHAALGIPPVEIASFQSVCASAIMAIKSAWLQIKAGEHRCAGVFGAEFSSRYFRPGFYEGTSLVDASGNIPLDADFLRFTMSDGAGAAILENRPNERQLSLKVHWIHIRSFADRFDSAMTAGGQRENGHMRMWSEFESPAEAFKQGALVLLQDFRLLKRMIPVWVNHFLGLIDQGQLALDEFDWFCSHYSSHSLREQTVSLLEKAGAMIPEEKWFSNLYSKGNTGSASIFIMLEELYHSGRLKSGQKILCHVPESGRCTNGFMMLEVI